MMNLEECSNLGWVVCSSLYCCPNTSHHGMEHVRWRPSLICSADGSPSWLVDFACMECGEDYEWTACVICGDERGRKRIKGNQQARKHLTQSTHINNSLEIVECQKARDASLSLESQHVTASGCVQGPGEAATAKLGEKRSFLATSRLVASPAPSPAPSSNSVSCDNRLPLVDDLVYEFRRKESRWFFQREAVASDGARSLIIQSHTYNKHFAPDCPWEEDDVTLGIMIAEFVLQLSQSQQKSFADILRLHEGQVLINVERKKKHGEVPNSPKLYKDIRSQITSGKRALVNNLPYPWWEMHRSVAYLSIMDAVQDFLAYGFEYDPICPPKEDGVVRTPGESKFAQAILRRAKLAHRGRIPDVVLYLILWEDDYEANGSKKNTGHTAYQKNLTISPTQSRVHPGAYTYPLVLGPKNAKQDYEEVQRKHNAELQQLQGDRLNHFYHLASPTGRVSVHAEVLAVMGDQPARRKAHHLLAANGRIHGRFGYIMDHFGIWEKMPSCPRCRDRLKRDLDLGTCSDCISWDSKDMARKITFAGLIRKTVEIRRQIKEEGLGRTAALKMLQSLAISNETAIAHYEVAVNLRISETLGDDYVSDRHVRDQMLSAPYLYNPKYAPASWCIPGVEVENIVEAVMHLLFLGITKDVLMLVHEWLSCSTRKQPFLDVVGGKKIVETVENMSICWCKAKGYGISGKFGGHVSEHYLATARLLPWIMIWVQRIKPEKQWVEPDKGLPQWSLDQCNTWLKLRGLPYGKMKLPAKKVLISRYRNQPGGEPPLMVKKGGPLNALHHVMMSLYAFLPRVMVDHVTEDIAKDAERHIRIFLDAFEDVDKAIREGKPKCQSEPGVDVDSDDEHSSRKSKSCSKGNHLGLVNIPDMMRNLGPLRGYWDGGSKGEQSLQDTKSLQTGSGVDPEHVMKKVTELGAIRRMKWSRERKQSSPLRCPKNFCRYCPENYAREWVEVGTLQPVSCVFYIPEKMFWLQLKNGMEIRLVPEKTAGTFVGLEYFSFSIPLNLKEHIHRKSKVQTSIDDTGYEFCILLPLPCDFNNEITAEPPHTGIDVDSELFRRVYAVIGHRWTVYFPVDKTMSKYELPGYTYGVK